MSMKKLVLTLMFFLKLSDAFGVNPFVFDSSQTEEGFPTEGGSADYPVYWDLSNVAGLASSGEAYFNVDAQDKDEEGNLVLSPSTVSFEGGTYYVGSGTVEAAWNINAYKANVMLTVSDKMTGDDTAQTPLLWYVSSNDSAGPSFTIGSGDSGVSAVIYTHDPEKGYHQEGSRKIRIMTEDYFNKPRAEFSGTLTLEVKDLA